MRRRSGSTLLESAMFIPVMVLLLIGMIQLARVGWIYFTLQKQLYTMVRYVGLQQGVNFCDDADPSIVAAKNLAVRGSTDDSGTLLLPNFNADSITIRAERYSADSDAVEQCECAATGCDIAAGGRPPDYISASLPDGYTVTLTIPFLPNDPIPLRPHVRVPFGGT